MIPEAKEEEEDIAQPTRKSKDSLNSKAPVEKPTDNLIPDMDENDIDTSAADYTIVGGKKKKRKKKKKKKKGAGDVSVDIDMSVNLGPIEEEEP